VAAAAHEPCYPHLAVTDGPGRRFPAFWGHPTLGSAACQELIRARQPEDARPVKPVLGTRQEPVQALRFVVHPVDLSVASAAHLERREVMEQREEFSRGGVPPVGQAAR
jgi:hypothetical protein